MAVCFDGRDFDWPLSLPVSGDDHQALIWDIQQMPRPIEDPILAYTAAEGEINQIQWGATQPDWIAICYNKNLEILRV